MSPQDSQQDSQEEIPPLPYGKNPSLKEMAIKATEEVIKAVYRRRKKRMPRGVKLRAMAVEHLERSIKDGLDNHVGTAELRH